MGHKTTPTSLGTPDPVYIKQMLKTTTKIRAIYIVIIYLTTDHNKLGILDLIHTTRHLRANTINATRNPIRTNTPNTLKIFPKLQGRCPRDDLAQTNMGSNPTDR